MDTYQIAPVDSAGGAATYDEVFRTETLSAGVYIIPEGQPDPQEPHTEDEVYCIHSGRAQITVGNETAPVSAGSVVFVAAGVPHRFSDVTEDLSVLVIFAPPEYSQAR